MQAPERIALDKMTRVLTIHWHDGRADALSYASLRGECPCSTCRRIRLQGGPIAVADDVEVVGIRPMGYGMQFVFSDGHAQGIYPWPYLDALARQAA
ncbi:DUF971 domain-containing protein [Trinickia terrae]|uniref:DUF971 domain-containing protein n=2 Tax=Trinickia terrae TaxID=2571161 RepID=A0A4U1IG21_9BURK|nr:DUF971 domain-containing protein [Trinickia terrae]